VLSLSDWLAKKDDWPRNHWLNVADLLKNIHSMQAAGSKPSKPPHTFQIPRPG
jgi:hypothetical protein